MCVYIYVCVYIYHVQFGRRCDKNIPRAEPDRYAARPDDDTVDLTL